MTEVLRKGRYRARLAETDHDIETAQRFRHLCFMERGGAQASPDGRDQDRFDGPCRHVLVEDQGTGQTVGCFRLLLLPGGRALGESYSAQSYDLAGLAGYAAPMAELGRFCCHPDLLDPDILRIAWGALTRLVDAAGVRMLFGCSSFPGTDPAPFGASFALLAARHLGPPDWRPAARPGETAPLHGPLPVGPEGAQALRRLPPLLRTYLAMGGWVGAQAVIDRRMNTLHVFTALEIASVPPRRAAALRALAQ